MLRLLTLALAAVLAVSCAKAHPEPARLPSPSALTVLARDIDALLDRPGQQRATWGVVVQSLRTGDRLYARNPRTLLVPASALKIVTAATAAAAVGWDYAFTTAVAITGTVEGGALNGDLLIAGTGDPSTEGEGGVDLVQPILEALHARGITRIAGRIVGDDSAVEEARPGQAWSWDDLGTTTGTLAGALNAAENVTQVVVSPGAEPGAPTSVGPPADDPDLPLLNRSVTVAPGARWSLWPERPPGERALVVAGGIAQDARPALLTVAVGNPTRWVAAFVRSRLIRAGVAVEGPAIDADDLLEVPVGTPLVTVTSKSLAMIVRPMLKRSINMYADALLRLATGPAGVRETPAATAAARRQLQSWGVAEDGIWMVDGSGQSRQDLASAEAMTTVLAHEWSDGASPLVRGLPVAGVDGSLAGRMVGTAAAGNVRAKTGSMTHVRSLAGYVTTRDGEPLAFTILVNNFEGPPSQATAAIDAVAVRLAEFQR